MSTLKRAKVVMLPTNEKATILYRFEQINKCIISHHPNQKNEANPQNLYILSDEEIKEGDWCVMLDSFGNVFSNPQHYIDPKTQHLNKGLRKIIATTDKSLEVVSKGINPVYEKLPQPSEGFLDVYVDFYNRGKPITEVMVEYEEWNHAPHIKDLDKPSWLELKINPKDNTITIHKCKDSWSREEVKALALQSFLEGVDRISAEDFDKWIEENI